LEETQVTNDAPLPPSIPPQPAPVEAYAVFAGVIEQATIQRIFAGLGAAMANKVQRVHLLFQSTGGTVADGLAFSLPLLGFALPSLKRRARQRRVEDAARPGRPVLGFVKCDAGIVFLGVQRSSVARASSMMRRLSSAGYIASPFHISLALQRRSVSRALRPRSVNLHRGLSTTVIAFYSSALCCRVPFRRVLSRRVFR
jgi:hypothetical protein